MATHLPAAKGSCQSHCPSAWFRECGRYPICHTEDQGQLNCCVCFEVLTRWTDTQRLPVKGLSALCVTVKSQRPGRSKNNNNNNKSVKPNSNSHSKDKNRHPQTPTTFTSCWILLIVTSIGHCRSKHDNLIVMEIVGLILHSIHSYTTQQREANSLPGTKAFCQWAAITPQFGSSCAGVGLGWVMRYMVCVCVCLCVHACVHIFTCARVCVCACMCLLHPLAYGTLNSSFVLFCLLGGPAGGVGGCVGGVGVGGEHACI